MEAIGSKPQAGASREGAGQASPHLTLPGARTRRCLGCNHYMVIRKPWLWRCPSCAYLWSTLPAGSGTGVVGLSSLRRRNFQILLDRVQPWLPREPPTVLEVGCATGIFLEAARERGLIPTGVEPDAANSKAARAKDLRVLQGAFPGTVPEGESFGAIFFNDSFEHLARPDEALRACRRSLAPDGILVLNLPDSDGVLYRAATVMDRLGVPGPLRRLWQIGFPSPHVSYFNRHNLRAMTTAQTSFTLVHETHLRTISASGLRERIRSSVSEPAATMAYLACLAFIPAQSLLPADILVQVYRG